MTKTAEQILKATVAGQAVIPYVAPVETVEVDEIKSALEVAQEEYRKSLGTIKNYDMINAKIADKYSEFEKEIAAIEKEIRKIQGTYKRTKKLETCEKFYNLLLELRAEIDKIEDKKSFLVKMRNTLADEALKVSEKIRAAQKAICEAAKQEGFKYIAVIRTYNGRHEEFTKTMAEAVSQIYINADILMGDWEISTIDGYDIASGYKVLHHTDKFNFEKLIDKYDEKYIDAEFAPVSEKAQYTPATLEEEFNIIMIRSIHNFTLGNYVESIEELKTFCDKAIKQDKNLFETALKELVEWIGIAKEEGIEVEGYNFEETENGWNVRKDNAATFSWTYYSKYPIEGFGSVEIQHPDCSNVYNVRCDLAKKNGDSINYFLSHVAKPSDIFVFALKVDGVLKENNEQKSFCASHYDADFFKGTDDENKAAAFAYADYLVEFLSHFEKTAEGYILNQDYLREYIYGKDSDETSETTEEPAEEVTEVTFEIAAEKWAELNNKRFELAREHKLTEKIRKQLLAEGQKWHDIKMQKAKVEGYKYRVHFWESEDTHYSKTIDDAAKYLKEHCGTGYFEIGMFAYYDPYNEFENTTELYNCIYHGYSTEDVKQDELDALSKKYDISNDVLAEEKVENEDKISETAEGNSQIVYKTAATTDLANISYLMENRRLENEYRAEKGSSLVSQLARWNVQEKAQTLKNVATFGKDFLIMYFSYKSMAAENHKASVKTMKMARKLDEQLQKEGAQVRRFDTLYWKNSNAGKSKAAEKYAVRCDEHYQKYDELRKTITALYGQVEKARNDEKFFNLVTEIIEEQAAVYVKNQPVISDTSEKFSDDGNKFTTNTENQIEPIKDIFYAESEEDARALVEPFKNYYDVKIEVEHFESNLIGFDGKLIARKGDFKALYISNRWRHQNTIIYNAKIVSNAEVTKKFTQKQIEGIAKYHGLKLKDNVPAGNKPP